MGFTIKDSVVRGDLFVRRGTGWSGKWKYTVAIDMHGFWDGNTGPVEAVIQAIQAGQVDGVVDSVWANIRQGEQYAHNQPDGYWLVVTEPYHKRAYPVMIEV